MLNDHDRGRMEIMLVIMIKGLPDVRGNEKNTMYIVGNGFDLAHKILSKYKHFYCWLNLNGYEEFADCVQKIYPQLVNSIDSLWCNFEKALEEMKLSYLFKEYVNWPNNNWDDKEWEANILQGDKRVKEIVNNIPILINEWAEQISVNVKPLFSGLSPESKYLSFNYTLTLENVYHIPEINICHIHERVKNGTQLIVGHNSQLSTNNLPANSDEEERAMAMFVETNNGLVKPVRQQIDKYRTFFNNLSNVDTVVVIGHSLAHVDLRYFCEVRRSIKENAKWLFSKYTSEDVNRVMAFVHPAKSYPNNIYNFDIFDINN